MNNRLQSLQTWLKEHGHSAALITAGTSFAFLTGWHTEAFERLTALLVPAAGEPVLIVPGLDRDRALAAASTVADQHVWADGTDPWVLLASVAARRGVRGGTVAVDKASLSLAAWEQLSAALPGAQTVDLGPVLEAMRMVKDPQALAALQLAADLLNPALEQTVAAVRPGMTERQVARILRDALEQAGAEGLSFDPLVQGGPNTALPHGGPGDRPLGAGDLLLLDFGARKGGYCSDITRVFTLGEFSARAAEIYGVVLEACRAGLAAVGPGVLCGDVDAAARRVIDQAGYEQYFTHRTGHGLGLDVHEPPYLAPGSAAVLQPGNVVTVEPGIYLPGFGGVRIEEMVAVTDTGRRVLTTFPVQPRILPV